MKETIYLRLEGLPPTLNHSYRARNGSRGPYIYKTAEAANYQEYIAYQAKVHQHRLEPAEWYGLRVRVHQPDRRRDVDAHLKIIQDGLCQGLGINDRLISTVILEKHILKGQDPYIELWFGTPEQIIQLIAVQA